MPIWHLLVLGGLENILHSCIKLRLYYDLDALLDNHKAQALCFAIYTASYISCYGSTLAVGVVSSYTMLTIAGAAMCLGYIIMCISNFSTYFIGMHTVFWILLGAFVIFSSSAALDNFISAAMAEALYKEKNIKAILLVRNIINNAMQLLVVGVTITLGTVSYITLSVISFAAFVFALWFKPAYKDSTHYKRRNVWQSIFLMLCFMAMAYNYIYSNSWKMMVMSFLASLLLLLGKIYDLKAHQTSNLKGIGFLLIFFPTVCLLNSTNVNQLSFIIKHCNHKVLGLNFPSTSFTNFQALFVLVLSFITIRHITSDKHSAEADRSHFVVNATLSVMLGGISCFYMYLVCKYASTNSMVSGNYVAMSYIFHALAYNLLRSNMIPGINYYFSPELVSQAIGLSGISVALSGTVMEFVDKYFKHLPNFKAHSFDLFQNYYLTWTILAVIIGISVSTVIYYEKIFRTRT